MACCCGPMEASTADGGSSWITRRRGARAAPRGDARGATRASRRKGRRAREPLTSRARRARWRRGARRGATTRATGRERRGQKCTPSRFECGCARARMAALGTDRDERRARHVVTRYSVAIERTSQKIGINFKLPYVPGNKSCHSREPRMVVGSARLNERILVRITNDYWKGCSHPPIVTP